jgi:hypothetical protein
MTVGIFSGAVTQRLDTPDGQVPGNGLFGPDPGLGISMGSHLPEKVQRVERNGGALPAAGRPPH